MFYFLLISNHCDTVVRHMQKVNRKIENSIPYKSITPENYILKLRTYDYVWKITHHASFGFNRYSGASPQIGEI